MKRKVFVDKPKTKSSTSQKPTEDIIQKEIERIHKKPPKTVSDLLKPSEPNLERTAEVQRRQLGGPSEEQLRLELEKKLAEEYKKLFEAEEKATPEERSILKDLLRSLPSYGTISASRAALRGDILGVLSGILTTFRQQELESKRAQTAKRTKQAKEAQVLDKAITELDRKIKALEKERKKKVRPTKKKKK